MMTFAIWRLATRGIATYPCVRQRHVREDHDMVRNPTRSQEIDQARTCTKALRHVCPKQ